MPKFEIDPNPPQDFIGPRLPACRLEDHRWALTIEDGRPSLLCLDPCSEERKLGMDTERHGPMCDVVYEFVDFMCMDEIPVRPEIKTEHTPSTPAGPAEWDAWLVVRPAIPVETDEPRLGPEPDCEWCLDSGWVEDYDRPDDDDTPKPCEHCERGQDDCKACRRKVDARKAATS